MITNIEQVRIIEIGHSAPNASEWIDKINKSLKDGWVMVLPPTTLAIPGYSHPVVTTFVLGLPRKPEPFTYSTPKTTVRD